MTTDEVRELAKLLRRREDVAYDVAAAILERLADDGLISDPGVLADEYEQGEMEGAEAYRRAVLGEEAK